MPFEKACRCDVGATVGCPRAPCYPMHTLADDQNPHTSSFALYACMWLKTLCLGSTNIARCCTGYVSLGF